MAGFVVVVVVSFEEMINHVTHTHAEYCSSVGGYILKAESESTGKEMSSDRISKHSFEKGKSPSNSPTKLFEKV